MARISNLTTPTNNSITVLIQFDQGDSASNYLAYIRCIETGQSSGDVGYSYSSSNPHWSQAYTFSGLDSGTTYTFQGDYRRVGSSYWQSTPYNYYTTSGTKPQRPTDRVAMSVSSVGTNSISMKVIDTYGATDIIWEVREYPSERSVYYSDLPAYSTPYYHNISGLTAGTEYTVYATGYNSVGVAPNGGAKKSPAMTNPATPRITGGSVNQNKATVIVSPNGGFDQIEIDMLDEYASGVIETETRAWNGGGSLTVTFDSTLASNATYLFRARAKKGSSYASYYPNPSAWSSDVYAWYRLKNEVVRPLNWNWTTANNSSGNKISGTNFSMLATEWNSFTQRINEFRKYKGITTNYPFTSASRGMDFYYYMFNEANAAISGITSTGLTNVTKGDRVYASYFNGLKNSMNNVT